MVAADGALHIHSGKGKKSQHYNTRRVEKEYMHSTSTVYSFTTERDRCKVPQQQFLIPTLVEASICSYIGVGVLVTKTGAADQHRRHAQSKAVGSMQAKPQSWILGHGCCLSTEVIDP